jgi:hypothetical protein
MRLLGWSFLYISCAFLGAAVLQSLYFQSLTFLSLNDFLTALSREPTSVAGLGQIPSAVPPLALGLSLLARSARKSPRIFGPKRRSLWG